jgi:hypothetical protein
MTDRDKGGDKTEKAIRKPEDEEGSSQKSAVGASAHRCPVCQMPFPHHLASCERA